MNLESSTASLLILISTIIISVVTMHTRKDLMGKMLLNPYQVVHGRKWYLLLTSTFIHADFMHLAFNMMTFYFFAMTLEATIGSLNFLIIYFGSAIASDISTVIKQRNNPNYNSLGASGAVSGVLFSYILFYPKAKIAMFMIPIGIPSPIFALFYLAYCYYASKKSHDFINHDSHLWGAIAGLILTALLIPNSITMFLREVF